MMIDLKLRAGDMSKFQNSTLIRLLIEYRHAGALLTSCGTQENEALREVLLQTAQTIERELSEREARSTMLTHLSREGATGMPIRSVVSSML